MAYGGPTDYEWEEVENDDWEVQCVDDDEQQPGLPKGGIEFTIEDAEALRRVKRSITKREREAAAAVHRSHVLCLAARALLLDWAAEQPEVQATALSLLPTNATLRNLDAEEPQRAINGMGPLMSWFRNAFAVLPPDVIWQPGGRAEAGRLAPEDEMDQQLLRTARSQSGTVECLVALFVAMVRAQGGSSRVVRLLDAVPLAPWRARPVTVRTAGAPPAAPPAAGAGGGGRSRQQRPALDLEAGDQLPATAGSGSGGAGGRGKGAKGTGRRLDDVLELKLGGGRGAGGGRGKKRKAAPADDEGDGAGADTSAGAARTQSAPAAVDAAGGRKRRKGDVGKRVAGGPGGDVDGGGEAAAVTVPAQTSAASRPNRGEEEFERELQMALLATSLEAEARQTGVGRPEPDVAARGNGAKAAAGGGGGAKKPPPQFLPPRGKGGKAAGGAAPDVPRGAAMSSRPDVVVNCWAEVYCGSADRGRWVAVDVINGYVDRPELIDTATFRPNPVRYVVAVEQGALLDVTPRYCHTLLAAQRNRDEAWWAETTGLLQGRKLGRTAAAAAAAAAERDAGEAAAPAGGGGAAGGSGSCRGDGTEAADAKAVRPDGGDISPPTKGANGGGGGGGSAGPRIINARLSHQRGEMENPQGPNAAAKAAAAAAKAAADASGGGSRPGGAAKSKAPGGRGNGGGCGGGAEDLRAAREAAELQHRGMSQLQGLPTSIEGFKSHPLYVLRRHIGKYEALRPGTAPLGLHRGEPYYPRNQLSVLHTVERWRREGRQVRDSELRSPAKVAKKRAMGPPGPGGPRRAASAPANGGGGKRKARGEGDEEEEDQELLMLETAGDGASIDGPTINLYGRWQTDSWVPPVAEDGIVPKNERGNVECPPLVPQLPRGTVHLTLGPGLGGICRSLGLDFAPGLVGFEVQGGRMVPKLEGVVVCEEVAEIVVAAYVERETARGAAAVAKRRRTAVAAWLQLLGSIRVRLQLERDYAGAGDEARVDAAGGSAGAAAGAGKPATGGAAAAAAIAAAVAAGREAGTKPRGAVAAAAAAAASKGRAGGAPTQAPGADAGAAAADAAADSGTAADVEMEEF